MIVDMRIYTVKPGQVGDFVAFYREFGWPLQQKYLSRCLGWFTGSDGQPNQIVHLWGYDSLADRERRRAEMFRDPEWQDYLRRMGAGEWLLHTENRFLAPTDFSPMQ